MVWFILNVSLFFFFAIWCLGCLGSNLLVPSDGFSIVAWFTDSQLQMVCLLQIFVVGLTAWSVFRVAKLPVCFGHIWFDTFFLPKLKRTSTKFYISSQGSGNTCLNLKTPTFPPCREVAEPLQPHPPDKPKPPGAQQPTKKNHQFSNNMSDFSWFNMDEQKECSRWNMYDFGWCTFFHAFFNVLLYWLMNSSPSLDGHLSGQDPKIEESQRCWGNKTAACFKLDSWHLTFFNVHGF